MQNAQSVFFSLMILNVLFSSEETEILNLALITPLH